MHKIANDYVSNPEYLAHFSQINREYRSIAHHIDLERIKEDYSSIISTTLNVSQILSAFYHLKRVKTIKEFASRRLPCMFRGILNRTKKSEHQNLAYLAFMMRDIYTPYYMETLRALIFVFSNGNISSVFWVNPAESYENPPFFEHTFKGGYKVMSQDNYIRIFQDIIEGSKVGSGKKWILLNKPWMTETAKLYGRDWAVLAPFGMLFAYSRDIPLGAYLISISLGAIVSITTVLILMNVYIAFVRRNRY